jgi:hypothetical protein
MSAAAIVAMADSTDPWEIPRTFAQRPNGAAPYYDGDYAWAQASVRIFPHVWRISVTGALSSAPHARVLDVERGDAGPADVDPYQGARAARGEQTTVYCNRSTFPAVVAAAPRWDQLLWWIATLDGNPAWTAATMRAWLLETYGQAPAEGSIRAIQIYRRAGYDESRIFGDPQWEAT